MIRGRLRPLTKNAVNGTYAKVLPIDGIFAECSTRRPSDKKLCLGTNQTSSILPSVVAAALIQIEILAIRGNLRHIA